MRALVIITVSRLPCMCNTPCSFFLPEWSIRGDGGGNGSEFRRADGSDEKDVRASRRKMTSLNSPTDTKDKLILLFLQHLRSHTK